MPWPPQRVSVKVLLFQAAKAALVKIDERFSAAEGAHGLKAWAMATKPACAGSFRARN
jgi:hypothetical protein